MPAECGHGTHTRLLSDPPSKSGIENLHEHPAHIGFNPLIEQRAKETPPRLRGDGMRSELASVAQCGKTPGVAAPTFHYRRKLYILAPDFLEKPVKLKRIFHVVVIDHRHGIPLHTIPLQKPNATHHALKSRFATTCTPIFIVKLLRSVNRNPDKPLLTAQKARPFLGDQRSVGLDAVHYPTPLGIAALKFKRLFIKCNRTHHGLATMPREHDLIDSLRLDILTHKLFERSVAHGLLNTRSTLLEIITILAC